MAGLLVEYSDMETKQGRERVGLSWCALRESGSIPQMSRGFHISIVFVNSML